MTNAAHRTTPGSGDLRKADFAGSAERLERIARELEPGAIAFVGKEAYRGAFGERPELGLRQRTLGSTWLFVLPSTSPANAAVPYAERLRQFRELAELVRPLRRAVRAVLLDPAGRTLLVRFRDADSTWWATPGGGIDVGETHEQALARELVEEAGLTDFELGPEVWTRRHRFPGMQRHGGQEERYFLVRARAFEPQPSLTREQLAAEGVVETRWWSLAELEASGEDFAPRSLPALVRELLESGPPPEPVDVGV